MFKEPKTLIIGIVTAIGSIVYTQFNVIFGDYFKVIKSYMYTDE